MTNGDDRVPSGIVPTDIALMQATFWEKGGRTTRFNCVDCSVEVGPNYAEVILLTLNPPQQLLFCVTDDPDHELQLAVPVYSGFILRDATGQTIERITIHDSKTIN